MAFDEEIAVRLRKALGNKNTGEKKMFGGIAFMLNGHMCCGLSDDRVLLRLGNEGATRALAEPHVEEVDFTGKPIKSMVYLTEPIHGDQAQLKGWVAKAVKFISSLPPR